MIAAAAVDAIDDHRQAIIVKRDANHHTIQLPTKHIECTHFGPFGKPHAIGKLRMGFAVDAGITNALINLRLRRIYFCLLACP